MHVLLAPQVCAFTYHGRVTWPGLTVRQGARGGRKRVHRRLPQTVLAKILCVLAQFVFSFFRECMQRWLIGHGRWKIPLARGHASISRIRCNIRRPRAHAFHLFTAPAHGLCGIGEGAATQTAVKAGAEDVMIRRYSREILSHVPDAAHVRELDQRMHLITCEHPLWRKSLRDWYCRCVHVHVHFASLYAIFGWMDGNRKNIIFTLGLSLPLSSPHPPNRPPPSSRPTAVRALAAPSPNLGGHFCGPVAMPSQSGVHKIQLNFAGSELLTLHQGVALQQLRYR